MRHSSVQTTQNYADLLNSDVGEQVGKVFGNYHSSENQLFLELHEISNCITNDS